MRFLDNWQRVVNQLAHDKGFYDNGHDTNRSLLLVVGEITEAQEELRAGHAPTEIYFNGTKPEGFPVELADAVIRILDLAQELGIDLDTAMEMKHNYNLSRPYKHGKQF